ncbi:serine/threonine protein phosphatase [Pseudohalocynthiibacter aestuariivivens]|nr:metallophosphoesterase [Pseudohalocynthiibacter aestuariivivens]QIE47537.1 serine/threonine protein phosphatase [Pseudohalocynthiibacter aestuariivivens]
MVIYVIPDIHGQKAMLDTALARIEADGGADASLVVLGDLVDRGPDSRGVIDTLMRGQAAGRDWTVLRGNHDQLFLDFLERGQIHSANILSGRSWLNERLGGAQTLASYGVDSSEDAPNWQAACAAVPDVHVRYLKGLPYYHLQDGKLFVHAGILPQAPLEWQSEKDMIWIREPFLSYTGRWPWLVVHGHTAQDYPSHHGNRVNLDGGAGWGRPLYPAVFDGDDCWLLTETGRVPLRP